MFRGLGFGGMGGSLQFEANARSSPAPVALKCSAFLVEGSQARGIRSLPGIGTKLARGLRVFREATPNGHLPSHSKAARNPKT